MDRIHWAFWCLAFCIVALEGCQGSTEVAVPSNVVTAPLITSAQSDFLDHPYILAILPFENLSGHAHLNWLRRGLQEMLVSDLSQWPQLEVVSRDALGPVLREQWLQQRGFSSIHNTVGLGQLKGVRYLIQGKIYAPQHEVLTIDLQFVDVETGVVVGSVKSHGSESEIPRLEQELVTRAMGMFDPSPFLKAPSSGEEKEKLPTSSYGDVRVEKDKGNPPIGGQFHSHSVHQIDAFLALEKLTQQRREAYQLAATIWNEGWSFEMGQPFYDIWHPPNRNIQSVPIMTIPISVFFSPHRLADIFEKASSVVAESGIRLDGEGNLAITDEGSGANPLFIEQFHQPRRVIVRAINEQGDVLAVFSHWTWRTESRIHKGNPQRISLPMWPEPFISGLAQFPVDWVEREGLHVTFDAVVVPVPDEEAIVMLESQGESEEEKNVGTGLGINEAKLLQTVEQLIRLNWKPAIMEGLPLLGYLPGNKRTAVGAVHILDGKIVQVQFQQWPEDPLFVRSLYDLQSNLLGACVVCPGSAHLIPSPSQVLKKFRLHLTLVKDIHALHLGSRLR